MPWGVFWTGGGRRGPPRRPPELRLGSVFGVQLTAHWSWSLLLLLLMYAAGLTFTVLLRGWPVAALAALAAVAALLSVVCLYAHEVAHVLVARRFGLAVDRVSLFLLGGMAHIGHDVPSPRAELLISASGPLTSLVIGLVALLLGWFFGGVVPAVGAVCAWLAIVNVPLAVFNLVPAYPLDGGRILRALVWYAARDLLWASRVAYMVGQVVAAALLFAGLVNVFVQIDNILGGLWLVGVAWFMYGGAASAHRMTSLTSALAELPVSAVMRRYIARVDADTSLLAFAHDQLALKTDPSASAWQNGDNATIPYGVYKGDALVGIMGAETLAQVPRPLWDRTRIEGVMTPLGVAPNVREDSSAARAFQQLMDTGRQVAAVVAANGSIVGLISRADLFRAAERARNPRAALP